MAAVHMSLLVIVYFLRVMGLFPAQRIIQRGIIFFRRFISSSLDPDVMLHVTAMPKTYYCWKCKCHVPMLTDTEWGILEPMVRSDIEIIKEYRTATSSPLAETLDKLPFDSSEQVYKWSGYRERSPSNFYHHRLSDWGSECGGCGHLLRTPKASFCANCGLPVKS